MDHRVNKSPEDFYQYYQKLNSWAVNFQNNRELTVPQVKIFFSKWGNVVDVRQTGSPSGYCFVHFETKENARQCVLDLKDDPIIKLRFFSQRTPANGDDAKSNYSGEFRNDTNSRASSVKSEKKLTLRMPVVKPAAEILKNGQSGGSAEVNKATPPALRTPNLRNGISKTPGSARERTKSPEFVFQPVNTSKHQNEPEKPAKTESSTPNSTPGVSTPVVMTATEESINHSAESSSTASRDDGKGDEPPEVAKELEVTNSQSIASQQALKNSNSTDSQMVSPQSIPPASESKDMYKNLPRLIEHCPSPGYFPPFVPPKKRAMPPPKELEEQMKNAVPAREVIVANIPEMCPLQFIIDLFEKYQPICMTDIAVLPPHNLRYCVVYFKSSEDTEAVEKIFDRTKIFGKRLIVLRSESLLEIEEHPHVKLA
uniref:RRM domain-containing protein n=1 Tax=Bracon brevicornis TaxID=1563983 RepID=A0A6V7HYF5_9HYME